MREQKHFWREFEKWHHVKFEFEFDFQVLLLDKNIELMILRAREIGLRVRKICQNWRFSCTRRGISRARERHAAESRVACCICVLLRSPKKSVLKFFRRNYWTCRVCVHAKERPNVFRSWMYDETTVRRYHRAITTLYDDCTTTVRRLYDDCTTIRRYYCTTKTPYENETIQRYDETK